MDDFGRTFGTLDSTVQGLLVSIILIPAAIVSFGSGSIADRLSRTHAICLGCAIYGLGSLVCSLCGLYSQSQKSALVMLFFGRCICGAGEGVFLSAVTIYTIEVSPVHARGRMGCIVQLFICIGIMAGYFVCYGSINIQGSFSWRLPWVLQCFTCASLAMAVRFIPHSPRWLMLAGRRDAAHAAMRRLGIDEDVLFGIIEEKLNNEQGREKSMGGWRQSIKQFKEAFAPELRGRTILALFMLGVQQLAGIDGLLYYAPVLFKQAGLSTENATFLASGITGIVNVVFTIVGQTLSDKWGRVPSIMIGGVFMALAMTIIGILYSLPSLNRSGQYAVIAFIYVYVIAFIMSWAILMRVWVSESQPLRTRATVSSLALTLNWGVNFVIAFTTPVFLGHAPSGPYFLWGAATWFAIGIFWVWMPETKGTSIDREGQDLSLKARVPWARLQRGKDKNKPEIKRPPYSRRGTSWTLAGDEVENKDDTVARLDEEVL
ncbi:general substrate transporter [Desarmillaria tabescens]|uniref:General substrate transporter n=1 Tax=Armillaria tabescens TaxID=1929756 RepID=A0AA39NA29_ARMTA|nr:general substrate transporter [Desarmillaria tabescens]KAK0461827.1 general substrate transporter [Desarmillaria tabescens]